MDLGDELLEAYDILGWAHSLVASLISDFTSTMDYPEREFAGEEIGALLTISPRKASDLIYQSEMLTGRPAVLAALAEGRVDVGKAMLITEMIDSLSPEDAEVVEEDLLAFAETHHYSSIQRHARRVLHRLDPEAALRRHEAKKATRRVEKVNQDDGMIDLRLCFTALQGTQAWDRIDRLARTAEDGPVKRTMDQRRADVAFDLLMGKEFGAPQGESKVLMTIPATTLMGIDDEPGMLAGYGPIPADVARDFAAGGTWKRILTDPATGVAVEEGRVKYRPPAAMADLVRVRDLTCVAMGCQRAAHRCDLDHCAVFDGENTTPDNLAPLCRRHHRMKHHTRWTREQFPDGVHLWTSPRGRTHMRCLEPIAEPVLQKRPIAVLADAPPPF